MHVGQPVIIGPAHHQISDVDDEKLRPSLDVDPAPVPRSHLKASGFVLAHQDGHHTIVGVRACTDVTRPGRRRLCRVMVDSHCRNVAVNFVIEEGLLDTKRHPGRVQEMSFEHFHCAVIVERRLSEPGGRVGPQVGDEIALAFPADVVFVIGSAVGAEVIELFEVGLGLVAAGTPERLAGKRAVSARSPCDRMLGPELLLDGTREKIV